MSEQEATTVVPVQPVVETVKQESAVTREELRQMFRATDWKIAAALLVGQGLARVPLPDAHGGATAVIAGALIVVGKALSGGGR